MNRTDVNAGYRGQCIDRPGFAFLPYLNHRCSVYPSTSQPFTRSQVKPYFLDSSVTGSPCAYSSRASSLGCAMVSQMPNMVKMNGIYKSNSGQLRKSYYLFFLFSPFLFSG